jgi:DNA topoisomerase-1
MTWNHFMADKKKEEIDRELGLCPQTQRPVFLKDGRFGPYVQRAVREGSKMKPRNASLLKGMKPSEVTLELALQLLALPRIVGQHPVTEQEISVNNGRYGPYVKCGPDTRSLPSDMSPLDISFEQCLLLLAQPKKSRGQKAKKPVKILGPSPVTEQNVTILVGKLGLYVTDGVSNVSLPSQMSADELTLDQALEMLARKRRSQP